MLMVQAQIEGMVFFTADQVLAGYPAPVWVV